MSGKATAEDYRHGLYERTAQGLKSAPGTSHADAVQHAMRMILSGRATADDYRDGVYAEQDEAQSGGGEMDKEEAGAKRDVALVKGEEAKVVAESSPSKQGVVLYFAVMIVCFFVVAGAQASRPFFSTYSTWMLADWAIRVMVLALFMVACRSGMLKMRDIGLVHLPIERMLLHSIWLIALGLAINLAFFRELILHFPDLLLVAPEGDIEAGFVVSVVSVLVGAVLFGASNELVFRGLVLRFLLKANRYRWFFLILASCCVWSAVHGPGLGSHADRFCVGNASRAVRHEI